MPQAPHEETASPAHAWLAAAIPAAARSFRVADAELARTLELAGAALAEAGTDVEIGPVAWLRGESGSAIAPFAGSPPDHPRRGIRALQRVLRAQASTRRARRARRRLRELGYRHTAVLAWEIDREVRPSGLRSRLLLDALAVGHREVRTATIVEAVLADGGSSGATPVPLAREGALIAVAPAGVFRISVGPSRTLEGQGRALAALRSAPPGIASRVPQVEQRGSLGIAQWSRERRLEGVTPGPPLPEPLLRECVDFLAGLFAVSGEEGPTASLVAAATVVAAASLDRSAGILALGQRLEERLAGLPRGFAHGDFHHGNLLVSGGRLTGVIDWDAAGAGRLPVLDLLHLKAGLHQVAARVSLGPTIVDVVLPWVRSGGDAHLRELCARTGVPHETGLLEELVAAYWLDFVARDLHKSADRVGNKDWIAPNVELVAATLAQG